MQREEKQMDMAMEALLQRVLDLKNSIGALIKKMEDEYTTLSWPTVLDNYALISGQITSLNRLLKNEKTPAFRNHILLPLVLAPERDPNLIKLTEGRVQAFNHEVVPDYLRTKPEPEAEEKLAQMQAKANSFTPDAMQKQINALNKITSNLVEMMNTHRENAEEQSQKTQHIQTSNVNDTNALISAVTFGKSLKPPRKDEPEPSPGAPQSAQPGTGYHAMYGYQHGTSRYDYVRTSGKQSPPRYMYKYFPNTGSGSSGLKAPSMIKTNIKSASNTMPYSRP